jgi:hypothetical protein
MIQKMEKKKNSHILLSKFLFEIPVITSIILASPSKVSKANLIINPWEIFIAP